MLTHKFALRAVILAAFIGLSGCGGEKTTMINVPQGTQFVVSLDQDVSTKDNSSGDTFAATTTEPVVVQQDILIPQGSTVSGRLVEVREPGRVSGRAAMTLEVTSVTLSNGETYTLQTQPISLEADSGTRSDLEKIAAGTVVGAIIGGVAEGGKGAAIGAVIGAAGGGAVVLATKGDQLTLQKGQKLRVEVTQPTKLPVMASVGNNK